MRNLKHAVPALVTFGPIFMMMGGETHWVGALMLGVGALIMYGLLAVQSKELERLHARLDQDARRD